MSQKKKTSITTDQARSLNNAMHLMAVLIMRYRYYGNTLPDVEQELSDNFMDWYCDSFNYVITPDGKFDEKPVSND